MLTALKKHKSAECQCHKSKTIIVLPAALLSKDGFVVSVNIEANVPGIYCVNDCIKIGDPDSDSVTDSQPVDNNMTMDSSLLACTATSPATSHLPSSTTNSPDS
ncbi:hypothetical protein ARMGADRAFT_1081038 [Armillaria gallica]|uniref:Uncharacterized protein n=1 Tax=Armillaria gallica TaxID=47427 RepID=A0A2H3DVE6_ARMGA|nr:hypothetical protein ARMGADRAFT_1081038 [Armillaria gallica]